MTVCCKNGKGTTIVLKTFFFWDIFRACVTILVSKLQEWNWRNTTLIFTTLTKWRPRQYVTTIFNLCISICKHGLLTLGVSSHIIYECDHIMMFSHHWYAAYNSVLRISSCGISILELSKYWKERKISFQVLSPMTYTTHLSRMMHPTAKPVNQKKKKKRGPCHDFPLHFP